MHVLVIEPNAEKRTALANLLTQEGHKVDSVSSVLESLLHVVRLESPVELAVIAETVPTLALAQSAHPMAGTDLIATFRVAQPRVRLLYLAGGNVELAASRAFELGAEFVVNRDEPAWAEHVADALRSCPIPARAVGT